MTKDELIEELEKLAIRFSKGWHEGIKIDASDIMLFNQIAEALAQTQEPVAWFRCQQGSRVYYDSKKWDDCQPLYTHPPQRTWVGLTAEQMRECNMDGDFMVDRETAKLNVQAKLKELNT